METISNITNIEAAYGDEAMLLDLAKRMRSYALLFYSDVNNIRAYKAWLKQRQDKEEAASEEIKPFPGGGTDHFEAEAEHTL